MPIERYCIEPNCKGGEACINKWRIPSQPCSQEYVAADYVLEHRWQGEEPPPAYWWVNGTKVYRTYSDYCD